MSDEKTLQEKLDEAPSYTPEEMKALVLSRIEALEKRARELGREFCSDHLEEYAAGGKCEICESIARIRAKQRLGS